MFQGPYMTPYRNGLIIAALACAGSNSRAQAFKPLHFEMSAFLKTDNQSRTETSRIWIKALDKFRIEQIVGAQKVMTIGNGSDIWQVDTLRNLCMHRRDADTVRKMGQQTLEAVDLVKPFKKRGGKRIGQGKIDGVMCTTYKRRDKDGMTYMLWVLPDGRARRMATDGVLTGAKRIGEPIEPHVLQSRNDIKWLDPSKMDEALFRPPVGMKVTEGTKGP